LYASLRYGVRIYKAEITQEDVSLVMVLIDADDDQCIVRYISRFAVPHLEDQKPQDELHQGLDSGRRVT
jgi:hypothetical protein